MNENKKELKSSILIINEQQEQLENRQGDHMDAEVRSRRACGLDLRHMRHRTRRRSVPALPQKAPRGGTTTAAEASAERESIALLHPRCNVVLPEDGHPRDA